MDQVAAGRHGILVIGHGTRHVAGQAEFLSTVALVAAHRRDLLVQAAHLELVEPDIATGVDQLVAAGATRITAMPLLLLAAGHAKQDIPDALAEAARRHPAVSLELVEHLGCHPRLLELAERRSVEATVVGAVGAGGVTNGVERADRLLLVVGRGSGDVAAQDELRAFARLLEERIEVAATKVCFLAMARPSLDDALAEIALSSYREVTVYVHLLFKGDLLRRLRERVEQASIADPARRWRLSAHLGPTEELVDTILDRCGYF